MAEMYEVRAKVISQKGTCGAGHKVGDEWVIGYRTPEGICLSALNAMLPNALVLMFSGTFPWGSDPDSTTVACPDAANPVVFELRRVR
ncbi:MAG TPA: TIGR04076 family protein [Dehalococcoidia bacterium]|nr:TIGR04076 family protein [Dehalococcoidia bacterium]